MSLTPQHQRCTPQNPACTRRAGILFLALAAGWIAFSTLAPIVATGQEPALTTVRIASGLSQPLFLTHAPGDFERLFVIEKIGRVRIIQNGLLVPTPFLDISSVVNASTLEWGLLGIAFHPAYAQNGYFFVNYCASDGDSVIARYQVTANPNIASAASASIVLRIDQPSANHRGGWLDFGPDGYLYDFQGDGGGQNDPSNRAQNLNLLQGKILRLDVDGLDDIVGNADDDAFPADPLRNYSIPPTNPFVAMAARGEIWAYGLRNPWRGSFDLVTGDLWIADVGQNQREEVNFQPAGFAGGANYGWRCTEGTFCTGLTGCTCGGPTLTPPTHEYDHSFGVSITGGYVYRGCAIPELDGTYFFADYSSERIWSFREVGGAVTAFQERTAQLDPPGVLSVDQIASFGQDAAGELYICDYTGEIFQLVRAGSPPSDCNGNGAHDACDILTGLSADGNANGIPDECEAVVFVRGDTNADGSVDIADAIRVLNVLFSGTLAACDDALDVNDDDGIDIADAIYLLGSRFGGGPAPELPHPGCGSDPTPGVLDCSAFPACP